jgi:hypothetical protein
MATLSLHPSPHAINLSAMPPSRVPLRDAPSAVLNSPLRPASSAIIGQKRARAQHDGYDQQRGILAPRNTQDPLRRVTNKPPTELQRKLEASRRGVKPDARILMKEDQYAAWQTHYRKHFPTLNIFFESIPRELAQKLEYKVKSLGAVCSSPSFVWLYILTP